MGNRITHRDAPVTDEEDKVLEKVAAHRESFQARAEVEDKLSTQRRGFRDTAEAVAVSQTSEDEVFAAPTIPRWLSLLTVLVIFPLQSIQIALVVFFALLYFVPILRLPLLGYLTLTFFDPYPNRGGWRGPIRDAARRLTGWKWAAAYYPIRMIKTAPLDPNQAYVFGYHPHGLFGVGACAVFGCDSVGWDAAYPGVDVTLMTLKATFAVPFFREWILAHGIACCDRRACVDLLKERRSIALIIGGAKESLDARPATMRLYLKRRKGFIRVALDAGAAIVPTIGFGENDLFDAVPNPKGSLMRAVQDACQRMLSFALPLAFGRFVPPFPFPTIPFRRPLSVVVGAAIDMPADLQDRDREAVVDELHAKYVAAVMQLYETYAPESKVALEIS